MDKIFTLAKKWLPYIIVTLIILYLWDMYKRPCNCGKGGDAPIVNDPSSETTSLTNQANTAGAVKSMAMA